MRIRGTHMARAVAAVAAAGLMLVTGACGASKAGTEPAQPSEPAQQGPIEVVASINQWGSLAEQIGGDDVTVTSILSSTTVDAHDFEPKTSDMAAIAKAAIVVSNGAGYDAWATKNVSKNAVTVSAAQTVGAMEGDNPHLWFSKDARTGMAKELVNAFSKALPAKKKAFSKRYDAWLKREQAIEDKMAAFAKDHANPTYAATEAVAYYLMSDMGFKDLTPEGYAASTASEGEPAPADLQAFQKLVEGRGVDLLVNNTQEASDATNLITGTAGRSEVPVFDVSEQMPKDKTDLTDWIDSMVDAIDGIFDERDAQSCEDASTSDGSADSGDSNGKDGKGSSDGTADKDASGSSDTKGDGVAQCQTDKTGDAGKADDSDKTGKTDGGSATTTGGTADTPSDPGK